MRKYVERPIASPKMLRDGGWLAEVSPHPFPHAARYALPRRFSVPRRGIPINGAVRGSHGRGCERVCGSYHFRLCHGMWLFHLHSMLKLQLFYPVFPLAESTAKTFCWLSLWNFKEITNKIPQSRSPSAEILEKKYIFQYIAETKQPYTLTEP